MSDPTEDFAAMFEASIKAKRIEKGQTIDGTIVAIGPEVAFVDVGGKGEAAIALDELRDAEGHLEVKVGDRIQAVVVSTAGGLTLSRKLALGAATLRQLEDAFHSGLPVEGKVERAVKDASTSSTSSSTRKAAGTSLSRGGRCSRRSSAHRPPTSGDRSSRARS